MPYDANGNWTEEEQPFDYLKEMDRRMSASGGVPPAGATSAPPPEQEPPAPPPAPMPSIPQPLGMGPSRNQLTLEKGLGIKTYGPAAEAAKQSADAYNADTAQYEENTGQGRPQQYGTPEFAGKDKGPLSPEDTAEKFMADRAARGETVMRKGKIESPAERDARNTAYDAYVQRSRSDREDERNRLASRGDANRDRRALQDERVGAQLRSTNAMQGAGPGAMQQGGPMAQNIGGAILLGPNFGRPNYDGYGGRSNVRVNIDPDADRKLKIREDQEARLRSQGNRKLELTQSGQENLAQHRATMMERLKGNDAALAAYRGNQNEQTKRAALMAGVQTAAELAAALKQKDDYSGSLWFGKEAGRDMAFDPKTKAKTQIVKGDHAWHVDQLRNVMNTMREIDPEFDVGDVITPETTEVIRRYMQ